MAVPQAAAAAAAEETPDMNIRCVLVGDSAVGKTSLILSFSENKYPDDFVPFVAERKDVEVLWRNKRVSVDLVDTRGQEEHDAERPSSYPATNIFLLLFSLIDRMSLERVKTKWVPELQEHAPGVPFLLVGSKLDCRDGWRPMKELRSSEEEEDTRLEGQKCAQSVGAKGYFEVSAKTLDGLKDLFHEAIRVVLKPDEVGGGGPGGKKKICCVS